MTASCHSAVKTQESLILGLLEASPIVHLVLGSRSEVYLIEFRPNGRRIGHLRGNYGYG